MACLPSHHRVGWHGISVGAWGRVATKLIIFPLIFLIVFTLLGALGISEVGWDSEYELSSYAGAEKGYYDSTDHLVAFPNGTYAGEYGNITTPITPGSSGPWNAIPIWKNETGSYNVYSDTGERLLPDATGSQITFDMGSSLGLIAIVVGAIVLATIAGLRVMGSGTSDVSVSAILKGSVFISIWAVFSVTSLALITSIPLLGPIFYFFITAIYTLGIINQIGSGGET